MSSTSAISLSKIKLTILLRVLVWASCSCVSRCSAFHTPACGIRTVLPVGKCQNTKAPAIEILSVSWRSNELPKTKGWPLSKHEPFTKDTINDACACRFRQVASPKNRQNRSIASFFIVNSAGLLLFYNVVWAFSYFIAQLTLSNLWNTMRLMVCIILPIGSCAPSPKCCANFSPSAS